MKNKTAAAKKITLKRAETLLGKNISRAMPMLEELSEKGMLPLCIIGIGKYDTKHNSLFATTDLNEEHFSLVYMLCKSFTEKNADKFNELIKPKA